MSPGKLLGQAMAVVPLVLYAIVMIVLSLSIGLLVVTAGAGWALALLIHRLTGLDLGCRWDQGLWPWR
jgi:hypothetical protein